VVGATEPKALRGESAWGKRTGSSDEEDEDQADQRPTMLRDVGESEESDQDDKPSIRPSVGTPLNETIIILVK
jgi:hypothetical protein